MEIRLNVAFRNIKRWDDSRRRSEHVFDRMSSRGIGELHIREAVKRGAKTIRADGSIVAEFRWFRIVYREFRIGETRKIYPITVMEA
ncbi:hypothetical protein HYU15_04105 [Candidatus Woesearchaeota archaeon]|nr:hypothetical protein [Candidatus Woesearchaeota archaeon]